MKHQCKLAGAGCIVLKCTRNSFKGTVGHAGTIVTDSDKLYTNAKKIAQYEWNKKYTIDLNFAKNSRTDEIQKELISTLNIKLSVMQHINVFTHRIINK